MESQPAAGACQSKRRSQTHARLHIVHPQRKSCKSLRPQRFREEITHVFLCEPFCPPWLNCLYLTPNSSTSKIRVAFGGITPPAPRSPYPIEGGIVSLRFPPTFIPATPSSQPL